MHQSKLLAISGVKNSGKTTLITQLIPKLVKKKLKIATIKHDGHGFTADIEESDSYRHKAAGAYAAAVFSDSKYMLVKDVPECSEEMIIQFFPEADLILLEGFKNSDYPKIEIVRSDNSRASVCDPKTMVALISDLPFSGENIPIFGLNEIDQIAAFIYEWTCQGLSLKKGGNNGN
ncbi:MAG: molybdopterin-guanine dinucleotide biosynthesis protein B [Firmicutes bacterium]|nr:molybdopterin-guanine dinucleotide biosynthesis protein B [Bacillota bacterium]